MIGKGAVQGGRGGPRILTPPPYCEMDGAPDDRNLKNVTRYYFFLTLDGQFQDLLQSADKLPVTFFKRLNKKISKPKYRKKFPEEIKKFALTLSLYSATAYRYFNLFKISSLL